MRPAESSIGRLRRSGRRGGSTPRRRHGPSQRPRAGISPQPNGRRPVSVVDKVTTDLASLVTSHPMGEALEELALRLARAIDGEEDGRIVAALAKELRATLHELAEGAEGDV